MTMFQTARAALAALVLGAAGFWTAASAAEVTRINALVLPASGTPETMARTVPIQRRVVQTLSETLSASGVQVYDDRLVLDYLPSSSRYGDDELLSAARAVSSRTPLDVVVLFEIVAEVTQDRYAKGVLTPRVRIPARVLNVRTAQLVAAFEVEVQRLPVLPVPCDQNCLFAELGSDAKLLAADLGDALLTKLAHWNAGGVARDPAGSGGLQIADASPVPAAPPVQPAIACEGLSGDYTILLRDFPPDELLDLEKQIRLFSCFEEMRVGRSGATYAEYSYRTSAGSQRLDRNLRQMLKLLNLSGQVRFDGVRFEVVRVQTRQ